MEMERELEATYRRMGWVTRTEREQSNVRALTKSSINIMNSEGHHSLPF